MNKEYVSSAISMFAIVCGAMGVVTAGAWLIFEEPSPLGLLFSGVAGGVPIALLAPRFEELEDPIDRFLLIAAMGVLTTVAFAVADALIS